MATEAAAWMAIGDHEKAVEAVAGIIEAGPVAVHGALLAWARYAHARMTGGEEAGPGELWGMEVVSEETGEEVGAQALGSPALKGAVALLSCAANSDHDAIEAIVTAAVEGGGGEALARLMLQSLSLAAATLKAHGEGEARDGG